MNNDRNKKIEEVLNSLDGSQKAVMPAFFYTRLKARMLSREVPAAPRSWVLRPVFAVTALLLVLAINAIVLFQKNSSSETSNNDSETMQAIAAEYRLNDNNTALFEINQDK